MTYNRPLFAGNVLKVRLSCVKPSEKKGKKSAKNHGKGEKIKIGVDPDWIQIRIDQILWIRIQSIRIHITAHNYTICPPPMGFKI